MTKTLTEQWRDGTLETGWYYTKHDDGKIYIWLCFKDDCSYIENPEVKEVLAPVPSYDHFSQLVKKVERLQKRLEIATKALKRYEDKQNWDIRGVSFMKYNKGFTIARKALKEMEGVK